MPARSFRVAAPLLRAGALARAGGADAALRIALGLLLATSVVLPAGAPASPSAQEPLAATLREEVLMLPKPGPQGAEPVELETTLFRPPGDGPFPLVLINHGKATGDPHLQGRTRLLYPVRELLARGYAVATPMRQGFARSGGHYVGKGCNVERNGQLQADDVQAALQALSHRPDLDTRRVVVMGQSHGGLTTLALGARRLPNVVGLVNFAGGLKQGTCPGWETGLARAAGHYGAATQVPSLWFYGTNDSYFAPFVWHGMFDAYTAAGAQARLVDVGAFADDSHTLFGSSAGVPVWLPEMDRFFRQLGLPFDVKYRVVLADHDHPVPPPSDFAPLDDATRLPFVGAGGRRAYAQFLASAPPKAFAIGPNGAWVWSGGVPDAMAQALSRCAAASPRGACGLYAVDDQVVWTGTTDTATATATTPPTITTASTTASQTSLPSLHDHP